MKKIKKEDLLGNFDLKVEVGKSEPACMQCLPPAPMEGHAILNGILVHSRIDCPPDTLYMLREDEFKSKDSL